MSKTITDLRQGYNARVAEASAAYEAAVESALDLGERPRPLRVFADKYRVQLWKLREYRNHRGARSEQHAS